MVYNISIGPVTYSLVSEIPSSRLKWKTIAMARNAYNLGSKSLLKGVAGTTHRYRVRVSGTNPWPPLPLADIINYVITPRMLDPTAANWGAKTGFFWAGMASLCFAWAYFRLPEPKGRTYGELEILFARGVPARRFASTKITEFDEQQRPRSPTLAAAGGTPGQQPHCSTRPLSAGGSVVMASRTSGGR